MAKHDCSVRHRQLKKKWLKPDDIQCVTYRSTVNPTPAHNLLLVVSG
ncbi:hypothetical protein [Proteus hauseri]